VWKFVFTASVYLWFQNNTGYRQLFCEGDCPLTLSTALFYCTDGDAGSRSTDGGSGYIDGGAGDTFDGKY
jgi:hypothetical protein